MLLSSLSSLVATFVTEYLPVQSNGVKVAVAMLGSRWIETLTGDTLIQLKDRVLGRKSISISNQQTPKMYSMIEEYIMRKYSSKMPHCEFVNDWDMKLGLNVQSINKSPQYFTDLFEKHQILLSIKLVSTSQRFATVESKTASVNDLRRYVTSLETTIVPTKRQVTIEYDSNMVGRRGAAAESVIYSKLEEYMVAKYLDKIRTCAFVPKNGEVTISVNSASFDRCVEDIFEKNTITMTMVSSLQELNGKNPNNNNSNNNNNNNNNNDQKSTSSAPPSKGSGSPSTTGVDRIIVESETADLACIKRYVEQVISSVDNQRLQNKSKVIRVYRPVIVEATKDVTAEAYWSSVFIHTNKTFRNTVVSSDVQREFVDDVQHFMLSEQKYIRRGIPFKRGYILYGVPGTGKTSLIKALANEYSCDVFSVELENITTNCQLMKLLTDVSYHAANRKYLLVFEDIDRSPLFQKDDYSYRRPPKKNESGITLTSFLNAIDGVVEASGRILVMTANDISVFESEENKAVVRPGRIDKKVEIKPCDNSQVANLFKLFFASQVSEIITTTDQKSDEKCDQKYDQKYEPVEPKEDISILDESKINLSRIMTSAELINLFMKFEKEPVKVRSFLYGQRPENGSCTEQDLIVAEPVDQNAILLSERETRQKNYRIKVAAKNKRRLRDDKSRLKKLLKTVETSSKVKELLEKRIQKKLMAIEKKKLQEKKLNDKKKKNPSKSRKRKNVVPPKVTPIVKKPKLIIPEISRVRCVVRHR